SEEDVMTPRVVVTMMLAVVLACPGLSLAQGSGDVWQTFAQKLEVGTELRVRLQNGQRFTATLVEARSDALVLQPLTRRPVPVQPVSYDAIQSLERSNHRGMSSAKAAGIGVAAGVGSFLAILAIFAASWD